MKMFYRLKSLFFLLLCIFVSISPTIAQEASRMVYVVLVDISASQTEEHYVKYVDVISNRVISNLSLNDYLVIYPIDAGTNIEPEKIFEIDLDNKTFEKRGDGFTHKKDSIQKRLNSYLTNQSKKVKSKLSYIKDKRSENNLKTDLFGALNQASIVLEELVSDNESGSGFWNYVTGTKSQKSKGSVLIFSDMINDTRIGNFEKDNLEKQQIIDDAIASYNSGLNLKDIDVLVFGRQASSSKRVEMIKSFWKRFFNMVGANLVAYGYDTSNLIDRYLRSNNENLDGAKGDSRIPTNKSSNDSQSLDNSAFNPNNLKGGYVGTAIYKGKKKVLIIDIKEVKGTKDGIQVIFDMNFGGKYEPNKVGKIENSNWGMIQLNNGNQIKYYSNDEGTFLSTSLKSEKLDYKLEKVEQ